MEDEDKEEGVDGGAVFWVYSHKSDSTEPGSRLLMRSSTCESVVILKLHSCARTMRTTTTKLNSIEFFFILNLDL